MWLGFLPTSKEAFKIPFLVLWAVLVVACPRQRWCDVMLGSRGKLHGFFFFFTMVTSFLSEAPVIPMLDLPGYNPLIFFIFSSYSLLVRIWFQGEAFSFIFLCTGWIFNALFPEWFVAILLFLFYRVMFLFHGCSSSLSVDVPDRGVGEVIFCSSVLSMFTLSSLSPG